MGANEEKENKILRWCFDQYVKSKQVSNELMIMNFQQTFPPSRLIINHLLVNQTCTINIHVLDALHSE